MTPMEHPQDTQERAKFEEWMRSEHPGVEVRVRNPLGMYTVSSVNAAWGGWEARAAIDSAAPQAAKDALTVIANWPCPQQDDMQAANMRAVAVAALKETQHHG